MTTFELDAMAGDVPDAVVFFCLHISVCTEITELHFNQPEVRHD